TFVVDAKGCVLYAHFGRDNIDRAWFNIIRTELAPVVARLRGGSAATDAAATPVDAKRITLLQSVIGRPALVSGVIVAPVDPPTPSAEDRAAPIAVTIKFIDAQVLANIAARLDLRNLRRLGGEEIPDRDFVLPLTGEDGRVITTVAWTPIRPGAEILHSV